MRMVKVGCVSIVIAVLAACGGKEEVGGTPVGSCTLDPGAQPNVSQWNCTSMFADASGTLPQCPGNIGAGGSCGGTDTTTDTTNPTEPAHYSSTSSPPCFTCTSNGLGVVWNCTSQVWEAGDVFSCGQ
jgi:hypothetical protein